MKFGVYLAECGIQEWEDHYLEYEILKKVINALELKKANDDDVEYFISKVAEVEPTPPPRSFRNPRSHAPPFSSSRIARKQTTKPQKGRGKSGRMVCLPSR